MTSNNEKAHLILKRHLLASTLLLSMVINNAAALEADKNAPILIEANQVAMAEKSGVSTYSGDVKLEQGSIKITAESIVVYTNEKKLQRIIATGKPALFSQLPNPESQRVQASANQVEYVSINGMLILLGNAKMQQGSNLFSGNKIEYDTTNNILTAKASAKSTQRVKAVIQPDTFRESQSGSE